MLRVGMNKIYKLSDSLNIISNNEGNDNPKLVIGNEINNRICSDYVIDRFIMQSKQIIAIKNHHEIEVGKLIVKERTDGNFKVIETFDYLAAYFIGSILIYNNEMVDQNYKHKLETYIYKDKAKNILRFEFPDKINEYIKLCIATNELVEITDANWGQYKSDCMYSFKSAANQLYEFINSLSLEDIYKLINDIVMVKTIKVVQTIDFYENKEIKQKRNIRNFGNLENQLNILLNNKSSLAKERLDAFKATGISESQILYLIELMFKVEFTKEYDDLYADKTIESSDELYKLTHYIQAEKSWNEEFIFSKIIEYLNIYKLIMLDDMAKL